LSTQRFSTTVSHADGRAFNVSPFNPNEVWGTSSVITSPARENGCAVRGPLGFDSGEYILPLGAVWRRGSGVDTGAAVEVELRPEGPQADALAPDIAAALAAEPEARAFFESLATFYRKGYLRWLEGAKRPEMQQARIAEVLSLLKAGKKQR
jgi:hypothetical protein